VKVLAERLSGIARTTVLLLDGNRRWHAIRQEQAVVYTGSRWIAGEIRDALRVQRATVMYATWFNSGSCGGFAPHESLSVGRLTIKTYFSKFVYHHMKTWSQSGAIEIMANREG